MPSSKSGTEKQPTAEITVTDFEIQQSFLRAYAGDSSGKSAGQIAKRLKITPESLESWREDRAFSLQFDAINAARVDRVSEIFAENAEKVALNVVKAATQTGGRNMIKAATLIFQTLGLQKTQAAFLQVISSKNGPILIQTPEQLKAAQAEVDELERIIQEADAVAKTDTGVVAGK